MKTKAITLAVAITALCGCMHTHDPLTSYKIADPNDPYALCDLPTILTPNSAQDEDYIAEWYRVANSSQLVGKRISDVISVYGQDYLISLYRGHQEPRMYYHLAGTHSWGFFGVVVLDADLRVRAITTDPSTTYPSN